MKIRLKKCVFKIRLRLGRETAVAEINAEKALSAFCRCGEKINDGDCGQAAVQLLFDVFGTEAGWKILAFYDNNSGEAAERLLPLLLGKVLKKSLKTARKRSKERARLYL